MTLRFFAALSLLLGLAALVGYLNLVGKGPFAGPALRHIRAMKDRATRPPSLTPVTMADFQTLPSGWRRVAAAGLEHRGVSLEGYVQRVLRAVDDDIHLEITAGPRGEDGPDSAYVSAEITPGWRRGSSRWTYDGLAAALRVNDGTITPWDGGPRRVRVSGWLLYDWQYDRRPSDWQLRNDAPRVSGWEIHPVTGLAVWDDAARAFVDYAR